MGALNCHQARPKQTSSRQLKARPRFKPSGLLQLTPELQARIWWLLAGAGALAPSFAPLAALKAASRDLQEAVEQSAFWQRKVDLLLRSGDFKLICQEQDPILCCVLLLSACRLLRASLSCDWLALHDLFLVLGGLGARPWALALVLHSLCSLQELPLPAAAHWLWDVVEGSSTPWLCSRPPPEAKSLEPLRAWLKKFVSNEICTWREISEKDKEVLPRSYASRCVRVALWLLLVRQLGTAEGLEDGRVTACVKAASKFGSSKLSQLWAVPLLFLAAPLRQASIQTKPGWEGLMMQSRVEADADAFSCIFPLSFPGFFVDSGWLHSQRGCCHRAQPNWVQLDARLDPISGTYQGQWAEESLSRPLDLLVFSLNCCDANFRALVSGAEEDNAQSELFGLATGCQDGCMFLRCFYLTKARQDADAAWW
ncbi:unnamed protein product [Effrenium voratum]|nr:unnamed protein product [Effrenium voratum]